MDVLRGALQVCGYCEVPWRGQDPSLRNQWVRGRRGAQCAPGELSGSARLHGASRTPPPTACMQISVYPWRADASIGPYRTGSRERFGPGGVNRRRTKKREETCSTPARFSFFVPRPHLWGSQGAGPLGRASRAIGSSGHLFRFLFGCSKRKDYRVISHYIRMPPQGGGIRLGTNSSPQR